jgi:hypothetical protein
LGRAIAEIARYDVEQIPVRVGEIEGYVALNATRRVACVDETRSVFTKWTTTDHRSDLAGGYRSINPLYVAAVPSDAHFFRVDGWSVGLIVSEEIKVAMERVGCLAAKFVDVT